MLDEAIQVRFDRLKEDVTKVLAANATNSAYIERVMVQIKDRLAVLEEDFSKNFRESD